MVIHAPERTLLQLMFREYMPLSTEAAVLQAMGGGSQNWCQSRRLPFLSVCPDCMQPLPQLGA